MYNNRMNLSGLAAVLLLLLATPVVMTYRIFPGSGTPYWLFAVFFLLQLINLGLAYFPLPVRVISVRPQIQTFCLCGVVVIAFVGAMSTAIIDRSRVAPVYGVHDIILQLESAVGYMINGKNPYKETYFGTPLEKWEYAEDGHKAVNPALYHFVMPPWYLVFPVFIYFFSLPILGYFDGRMALLLCSLGLMVILYRLVKDKTLGAILVTVTIFNPSTINYLIEGRSDMFALFWFTWSVYLLKLKKWYWSALIMALAMGSKQTIWFALPFYLCYLWLKTRNSGSKFVTALLTMIGGFSLFSLPFFIWDPPAFVGSVFLYLSGGIDHAYPISGYGIGALLRSWGIITDIHGYYPFVIWQVLFGLPILFFSLWWLKQQTKMSTLWLGYGLFLFVFWYMSRYFNNSHLGYISSVLVIGAVLRLDEDKLYES